MGGGTIARKNRAILIFFRREFLPLSLNCSRILFGKRIGVSNKRGLSLSGKSIRGNRKESAISDTDRIFPSVSSRKTLERPEERYQIFPGNGREFLESQLLFPLSGKPPENPPPLLQKVEIRKFFPLPHLILNYFSNSEKRLQFLSLLPFTERIKKPGEIFLLCELVSEIGGFPNSPRANTLLTVRVQLKEIAPR